MICVPHCLVLAQWLVAAMPCRFTTWSGYPLVLQEAEAEVIESRGEMLACVGRFREQQW